MTLHEYEIGLHNEFDITNLRNIAATNDIDAVSMIIKSNTLENAKTIYKHEFINKFGFNILDSEITGKKV